MTNPSDSIQHHLLACSLVNDAVVIDQQLNTLAGLAAPNAELRLWLLAENPVLKRREIEELAELHCPGRDVLLVIHDTDADDDELQSALACLENAEVLVIALADSFGERLADELNERCQVVRI